MVNDYILHRQKCARIADPDERKKCMESYVKKTKTKPQPKTKPQLKTIKYNKDDDKSCKKLKKVEEDLKNFENVVNNAYINLENMINRKVNDLAKNDENFNKRISNLEDLPQNRYAKNKSAINISESDLITKSSKLRKTRGPMKSGYIRPSVEELERASTKWLLGRMKRTKKN